jgi:hypothetical protein
MELLEHKTERSKDNEAAGSAVIPDIPVDWKQECQPG